MLINRILGTSILQFSTNPATPGFPVAIYPSKPSKIFRTSFPYCCDYYGHWLYVVKDLIDF